MNFNEEEILEIKKFCQAITNKPRWFKDQPHISKDGFIFCEDWELIEICKYLFHGKELYLGDPPPNRLKNNPLWSQEEIIQKAEALIAEHKTVDKIIAVLKERWQNVRTT